jgi:hypothetical protein
MVFILKYISNYFLEKAGSYFSPRINQHSKSLNSGQISYFDLEELVAFLISKKFITDNWNYSSKEYVNAGAGS